MVRNADAGAVRLAGLAQARLFDCGCSLARTTFTQDEFVFVVGFRVVRTANAGPSARS